MSEHCPIDTYPSYDAVIFISPGGRDGGGGMGSVTDGIVKWLAINRPDIHVHVIDPRGKGSITMSPLYLILGMLKVLMLRAQYGRSIIHIQVSERMSVVRKGIFVILGRILGCTTILHHHGAEFEPFYLNASRILSGWTRSITNLAHINIVLGQSTADFMARSVGVSPERIVVLPNAVADLRPALMRARQSDGNPSGTHTQAWRLLLLANLSPRKGVSEFLRSVACLRSQGKELTAILCGGGEITRYQEEARQLGLPESAIEFTGWVSRSEVVAVLARSNMFVLPSFNEGLPMSVLEAMSAEIPVITTPVGAIPEVLTDGVDCLLVPAGDAEMLKDAVSRLMIDRQLAQTLVSNARALYETQFEMSSYMHRLLKIYGKSAQLSEKM